MLTVRTVEHRLRTPVHTAWGTLRVRETLHVTLTFADGTCGEGEAAPLEPYDGVSLAAVRAALDAYAEIDAPPDELLAACAAERDLPQALAAIDLALWDRRARVSGTPIARLIAPDALAAVPVNATIGAEDRAGAAAAAARAVAQGFACVKVKVGLGDDAGRVAAVRAAAPELLIRVDANGAWTTPREALANLRALAPIGIELCEEPVHGAEALAEVRAESPVPIACDETFAPGSVDVACLKITRGGITGVLEAAREAADVYLASSFDGPLGLRAALHAAAGLKVTRHCGLATGALRVREGLIFLP
jgi:L-alanine-DL-glutamate epimerase-like enolase superfamily enzyme